MSDIYELENKLFGYLKCPVCEGTLSKRKTQHNIQYACTNSCMFAYIITNDHNYRDHILLYLFDKDIALTEENISEYEEMIAYWKENDRYLIKLMTK